MARHGMLSNAFLGSISNNNHDRTDVMGTPEIKHNHKTRRSCRYKNKVRDIFCAETANMRLICCSVCACNYMSVCLAVCLFVRVRVEG